MTQKKQPNLPAPVTAAIASLQENPQDVARAIRLGSILHDHGYHDEAIDLRNQIAAGMCAAARRGDDPNSVINVERGVYSHLVKKIETEENARASFQSWAGAVADLGRKFQSPDLPHALRQPTEERPWRMAFLLQTPAVLGHTEMLLALLRHRPKTGPWHQTPIVFVLIGENPELETLCAEVGAKVVYLESESGLPTVKAMETFAYMRARIAQEGVTHLAWVSVPCTSNFAFAMRLAPVQIFWTLKFHPYRLKEVDCYISYGSWSERVRTVHGEEWQAVPQVLQTPSRPVSDSEVAQARLPYAQHKILLGTLARGEKFNSAPFVEAVIRILRDNSGAGYLWTGREIHSGVQEQFERAGVASQCHFIGWVDTAVYARALDVFLETFPFGCGITGMQALYAGTPFLSYQSPETLFGMNFARPLADNGPAAEEIRRLISPGEGGGLLYPSTVDEYVALANRLIRDADFRRAAGDAGKEFYANYLGNSAEMANRFFAIVENCKRPSGGGA